MESAGLRRRKSKEAVDRKVQNRKGLKGEETSGCSIPRYTIDLSLPPKERYQHVAKAFRSQLISLPIIFDELVQDLHPNVSVGKVRAAAKLLLRRIHDTEQNEELKGIHLVTGIDMYLLVAFNVLLDLFMGCTSGGLRIRPQNEESKMLHFRTLDWGMDPLRQIVVQLDFVEMLGCPIIASSITYVGYVGVLTGVKQGLSMSLNFRPNHDASTRLANFRFYFHHLAVLFGFRPSISSMLRQCLLPSIHLTGGKASPGQTLASIQRLLPALPTTAAYLIFSDGARTITMEKDHHSATAQSSGEFIVITNHDEIEELAPHATSHGSKVSSKMLQVAGMTELTEESMERKRCATRLWEKSRKTSSRAGSHTLRGRRENASEQVVQLLSSYPITNEETHYAVVMDPTDGKVIWARRYLEPVTYPPL